MRNRIRDGLVALLTVGVLSGVPLASSAIDG